jgi:FkbH-like protein
MSNISILHWLAKPGDLRADLRAAAASEGENRLRRHLQIANQRLGFLETIQFDRALQTTYADPPTGLARVKLAVLADTTVDHLLPAIRTAGLRHRLWIETYIGPFGQYRQELFDADSGLQRFEPDVLLLALDPRADLAGCPLSASAPDVAARLAALCDDYRTLWRVARERLGASVIHQTCLNAAAPVFGSFDFLVPAAPSTIIDDLNRLMRAAASEENVMLLDVARASEHLGTAQWFDPVRWHQAKQSIAPTISPLYGELVARLLAAHRGLARKCLVVDLDNTLWGGVLGDDGLEGIVLGQGNPAGEAYADFQRYLKRLSERGVLLALCSKNAEEAVETVFRDHPEMVLSRADIAACAVNWDDKPSNLRKLAELLDLGLDSFVFFDDNPFEREIVRSALPMVAVPEVPEDCALYIECLSEAGYFEALAYTQEDRDRARSYVANAERNRVRNSASNIEDFLRGLDMRLKVEPFAPVDLPRVTQLINKTNQFNVMTRRYSYDQVAAMASDPNVLTFQARMRDRLGDNGLISVVILRRATPDDSSDFSIDTWLMSCRVLGRQVERELCNVVMETALARGATRLLGAYEPTAKNGLVQNLFADLGFQPSGTGDKGTTLWEAPLAQYQPYQTFITRE